MSKEHDFQAMGQTASKLVAFGQAVLKVRQGAQADANIQLNRNECRALIWGLQLLRTGVPSGES